MKNRQLLICLALAVLLVTGMVLYQMRASRRESYAGRHTRDWAMLLITSPDGSNRSEAISALRALGSNAVPPLRRMLQERDKFYEKSLVEAARALPAEQRRMLLQQLKPGQATSQRLAALAALGAIGPAGAETIPELTQSLADPNGQIRWDAARALVAMGELATPALISATTNTNAGARHAAIFALGQARTNPASAAAALFQATLDPDEIVRTTAIYYVGELGLDATPLLVEKLDSGEPATQLAAMRALAGVRPPVRRIAPSLLQIATNSTGPLRRQTIETMGALRVANSNALTIMIAALDDPDPAIRLAAMQAVADVNWKTAATIPRLEAFTHSTNAQERESAAGALARFGGRASNAIPALTGLLGDPEPEVRAAATNALWRIREFANPP